MAVDEAITVWSAAATKALGSEPSCRYCQGKILVDQALTIHPSRDQTMGLYSHATCDPERIAPPLAAAMMRLEHKVRRNLRLRDENLMGELPGNERAITKELTKIREAMEDYILSLQDRQEDE